MQTTREQFTKGTLAFAGLMAATNARAMSRPPLSVKISGYDVDRVRALKDGRVGVAGCDVTFEIAAVGDMNTDVFSGPQSREITEIGLHPFMLAYANDGFRDYTLLPVFPLRLFRHKSIFIRTGSGINKLQDLRGRKVATPGFSSTSLTWIRGIVEHEYGVSPKDIQWVISQKDSAADTGGKTSAQEQVVPDGLSVSYGPAGMDESDLLLNGEVDALFHAVEPKAYVQGDPRIRRFFPDYRTVEQAYFKKTGIFPIMHAVAMKKSTIEKNPWLPKAVFEAYCNSKKAAQVYMQKLGWVYESLPWFGQELEETKAAMGENYWPYGIEANRTALEALFQYSYEQGLASKKLTIEELFEPSTLQLTDG